VAVGFLCSRCWAGFLLTFDDVEGYFYGVCVFQGRYQPEPMGELGGAEGAQEARPKLIGV